MNEYVKHGVRSQIKTKPLAQFLSGVVILHQTTAEWRYGDIVTKCKWNTNASA